LKRLENLRRIIATEEGLPVTLPDPISKLLPHPPAPRRQGGEEARADFADAARGERREQVAPRPKVSGTRLAHEPAESRLRLQTIVRLRWFAVLGQILAVGIVNVGFGFELPVGYCLAFIAVSAWLNVFLTVRFPARHRLGVTFATVLLAYDILQLTALLYLTGGIQNPFTMLIVAPVTVSAATLPTRNTILLGAIAIAATGFLVVEHLPLPWYAGEPFDLPTIYKLGLFAAVAASMTFLAFYAWRLSDEARQMSAALAATELVLAREQQLHALDTLAAAAAHELGTPLATIALVTKELERDVPASSPLADDIALLRSQAQRCREILQKLTRQPSEQDPLHASMTVSQLLEEAVEPYRSFPVKIRIDARAAASGADKGVPEPVGERRPGIVYGLGNLIENAVDFAKETVEITARWDERELMIVIADDGPGFPPDVLDRLGEPYVTTRPSGAPGSGREAEVSGLGLGFFIAKTLLERFGAILSLENRAPPARGAVVRLHWSREAFEAPTIEETAAREGSRAGHP
jgi:two-component system, sensor histidine kinase RegB